MVSRNKNYDIVILFKQGTHMKGLQQLSCSVCYVSDTQVFWRGKATGSPAELVVPMREIQLLHSGVAQK